MAHVWIHKLGGHVALSLRSATEGSFSTVFDTGPLLSENTTPAPPRVQSGAREAYQIRRQ